MNNLQKQLIAAEIKLAGANPDLADIVQVMVENVVGIEEDGSLSILDGGGNYRINRDASNMTISDYLIEMKQEKPLFFFDPKKQAKSDQLPPELENNKTAQMMKQIADDKAAVAENNKAVVNNLAKRNPWSKDHWNITNQMRILKNDPGLAARLEEEAA